MIPAIIKQYGHKEGLTTSGDNITQWPYDSPVPTEEEIEEFKEESRRMSLISQLWRKADKYISSRISVGGIVRLAPYEKTHAKPKAIADWMEAIWADYYTRRAEVTAGTFASNFDFTNNGEMPFSFEEALAETKA
ncbi:MAG: hypothetical protein NE327_06355 [Lentisphaeraceae bacterium]|nr:hypothetical protein [Lentisphaeraceae bacterium]